MPEPLTRVLQKLGLSAKLNIWNSNEQCAKFEHEQCAKFEHSYFDFPAFAKPKTVSGQATNDSVTRKNNDRLKDIFQ
jgi:hypothetical protein